MSKHLNLPITGPWRIRCLSADHLRMLHASRLLFLDRWPVLPSSARTPCDSVSLAKVDGAGDTATQGVQGTIGHTTEAAARAHTAATCLVAAAAMLAMLLALTLWLQCEGREG